MHRLCCSAMNNAVNIASALAQVRQNITSACQQRDPAHILQAQVTLIAVSKSKPAADIRQAYGAGQIDFGENYLQEALSKQQDLADLAIVWHFIGPIQSNKTQAIAQHFAWVHGVDRVKIAQRLNEARSAMPQPLNICIQINISGEASKSGIAPAQLDELFSAILSMPHLRLRGLMTIPDPSLNSAQLGQQFGQMRELLHSLNQRYASQLAQPLDTLSMGMSSDYPLAIQQGATMVRVGSAIFGERHYNSLSAPN